MQKRPETNPLVISKTQADAVARRRRTANAGCLLYAFHFLLCVKNSLMLTRANFASVCLSFQVVNYLYTNLKNFALT